MEVSDDAIIDVYVEAYLYGDGDQSNTGGTGVYDPAVGTRSVVPAGSLQQYRRL